MLFQWELKNHDVLSLGMPPFICSYYIRKKGLNAEPPRHRVNPTARLLEVVYIQSLQVSKNIQKAFSVSCLIL